MNGLPKQLSRKQLQYIACGIVRGVVAGHMLGYSHRDVKPQNILFDDKLIPKVSDWGLSNSPRCSGTLTYMAPEQFIKDIYGDQLEDYK